MGTGALAAAGSTAASCCLNCCCNQFEKYVIEAEDNVKELKSKAETLASVAEDIKKKISGRQLGSSANRANNWLERSVGVEKAAKEVSDGWGTVCLPSLNFWSRYRFGKRASRELREAEGLIKEKAAFDELKPTSLVNCLQEKQIETEVVGMVPNLETALAYIDDERVGVVGICGMGGVGKTTLLRQIHGEFLPGKERSKEFDKVMWAVVSKRSTTEDMIQNDVASLQNEIARELGLLLDPIPDNQKGTGEVLERRAQPIYDYLCTKSFLLLLDDLWSPLELRSIGIPVPTPNINDRSHKHKVVLTSRSLVVCGLMNAQRGLINVQCLKDGDAWHLFEFNATKQTIESHRDIRELAWQVMKECQGLPLALNTIGKALATKSGDPKPWLAALNELRAARHVSIPGMELENAAMLHRLKISYDYLPFERYKDCFLSCCLWPEDYSIEKTELIECWLGLGIIPDSHDINTYLGIITSLKEVHLLEAGDDDASEVKMHDTIRDMALWISSDCGKEMNKWLVKAGIGTTTAHLVLKQWREGSTTTERVSLMNNFIEELPSEHIPQRTNLKVLMLQRNTSLREVPGSLLTCVPTLTYLDISNTEIEELPCQISLLRGLQYLNLSHSHINKLPYELSSLDELKYLLLSATMYLSFMPYGIISNLKKLQTLDIFQSRYTKWNDGENYNCAHLGEFENRIVFLSLGITVDTVSSLKSLVSCDMIRIKRLCLKKLVTRPSLHVLPSTLTELLKGYDDRLRSLQEFTLSACESIEEIIIDGGTDCSKQIHLPALEKLALLGVYNLREIRFQHIAAIDFFPFLRSVKIFSCYKLKNVNWSLHLPQLLNMELQFCGAMESLIDDTDMEGSVNEIEEQQHMQCTFPLLKTLTIYSLENLKCLCNGRSLDFPALEVLEIEQCSNLKQLNIRKLGKLKEFRGGETWWDELCWEDDHIQKELLSYFRAPRLKRNASKNISR